MDDLTQREFLTDLEELTEQLSAVTAELRQQQTSGLLQREILNKTFRCLHSIKGIAATAGITAVAELAHQTETLLDDARGGRAVVETVFIDMLEDVANAISEYLLAAGTGSPEPANDLLVQRLQALGANAKNSSSNTAPNDLPGEIAALLNEREQQLVVAALGANGKVCLIDASFDLAVFDTEFQKLRDTLFQLGEVICTLPSAAGATAGRIGFRIFFRSESAATEVQAHLLVPCPKAIVRDFPHLLPVDPDIAAQHREAFSVGAASAPSPFIRVELEELDRLRASAHEVFEEIVVALDLVSTSLPGDARTELRNLDAQVRQTLTALEDKIVELRTISVDRVVQRAILAGRVAARSTDKEVEFTVAGSDLRIDKVICDTISIPLLHLIRNAVDHGIELPGERSEAGKNPSGAVHIEAGADSSQIWFIVSDDGRGIDPQVISAAAATRGLIEKHATLDLDQSLRLIFRPGFSTASAVSSVSGRGVGLDVVEHSLAQIGGSVSVRSRPGKGSEFELRLPQRLSKG